MSTGINQSRNYKYRRLSNSDHEFSGCLEADGSDNEQIELQNRDICQRNKIQQNKGSRSASSTPEKDIILVEKPIVSGESLASISLKYRISISELKRVNKIQKDIEFYALSNVKIPVRTNSALLDILNDEMQSGIPVPNLEIENATHEPLNDKNIEAVKSSLAERESRILYERVDLPLIEVSHKSHNVRLYSTVEDKLLGTCSGADWDLSWWKVLLIGVILFLGLPLMYYLFYSNISK